MHLHLYAVGQAQPHEQIQLHLWQLQYWHVSNISAKLCILRSRADFLPNATDFVWLQASGLLNRDLMTLLLFVISLRLLFSCRFSHNLVPQCVAVKSDYTVLKYCSHNKGIAWNITCHLPVVNWQKLLVNKSFILNLSHLLQCNANYQAGGLAKGNILVGILWSIKN